MFSRLTLPWKIGLGFTAALAVSVALGSCLDREPVETKQKSETRTKTESREVEELRSIKAERGKIIEDLQRQLRERSSSQANIRTRVVERTERFAPHGGAAPVRVNVSGLPEPAPTGSAPGPYEVVTRETTTEDTSRTDTERSDDMTRRTDTETAKNEVEESRRTVDAKSESTTKTETSTKSGGEGENVPKLGVGVLTGQDGKPAPFASYDLINKPLGPKLLGLNKYRLGLGAFITKRGEGVDGGPQANLAKKNLFIMGGFEVKSKTPVVGIGLKF